jgi:hypothetical protein
LNGRVRNLPDSVWRHAVRWCLLVWQQDETVGPEQFSSGRCPSPRTGTRALAMEGTGRPFPPWRGIHRKWRALAGLSLSMEGHPPDPPAVRRRSIAPERPRKIASKQLNPVTPRTRAGPPPDMTPSRSQRSGSLHTTHPHQGRPYFPRWLLTRTFRFLIS